MKSSLRSNQPSRDIGDLGSVLRSDCRQTPSAMPRKRTSIQPSVLVVGWAPVRRRATIPVAENGPMSTPRRAHQDRRAAPTWRLGSAAICCCFNEQATWLPYSTTRDWRGSLPVFQHPNSNPRWAPGGEVTPDAFTDFSVFTITLLVASRQLLSSAAGEQVVAGTMANASLLGLVIWSVIIITLNTWDKSIRVVESWFNQHCKSRQSTNLKTLAFFQAERCAILDGASGMSKKFILCTFDEREIVNGDLQFLRRSRKMN